jgi:hypothetical protein
MGCVCGLGECTCAQKRAGHAKHVKRRNNGGGGQNQWRDLWPLDKLGCDSCRVKFVEVNEVRHGKVTCTCAQKRANQGKHVQKRARVHVLDFCTYARMHVPRRKPN